MQSRIPNWILATIIAISLIGFSDSAFLLSKRLSGGPIPCFVTTGCDTVSLSSYSTLWGIPLAAWGVAFYLGIGFLTLLYWDTKKEYLLKLIFTGTFAGFIMSAYFTYLQKFVIGAFCVYCLGSAVSSTTLFILSLIARKKLSSQ